MKGRILIADDDPIVTLDIRRILEEADYEVVAEATDGFEAIELCQKYRSDLVIMDIKMPLLDGLTATKKILDDALAYGVILLSAYDDESYVQKAKHYGASAYLVKPLDAKSLIPMVEVCIEKGRQLQQLSNEMIKLSKKIDDRIVIEKAKGLLMVRDQLSEPEAFKRIRTISMQKRVPMVEIARLLVLHDEI
ncbi:ANTAR domain-containing response regulator [Streptococcus himalayensis]|uniref:Fis family transcriptional regulator n=1 Tax=Streptococcus himalayensis TaxID=1888195 RepID=A0A917A7E9_9STRE|nr:response regulator [Streptococcus himalayensis]GGE33207.1 Fis family transcriptional regulator [Streptococcus himalayensis]